MPGRKSNVSTTSIGPEEVPETTPVRQTKEKKDDGLSVDDLSLPKSMIQRISKGNLPANTQIHKDALLALHKSATVFVSYLAANSNEIAQAGGKKTISPNDVMAALKDAEFEQFLPIVEAQLKKYNETQCDKRNTYRRKVKEEKAKETKDEEGEGETSELAKNGEATNGSNGTANGHAGEDGERPVKKLKGQAGEAVASNMDDADDEEMGDDQDADENDEADEEAPDDDVEDDDDDDDADQTMEDALEEQEPDDERGELKDEALDDGEDSD